ncbi:SGNH/GDSL hydrolase family protein [Paenibacillus cymbidii]|uniref:SGNH/GDSL hydrolase family protein n=1 Tax=Paenibacillus cymbidii TaxID=1639034 RepID=UPI001436703D|nr:SGNH/GDSL hydrolase family protein [Paenibacillus cymbidii]
MATLERTEWCEFWWEKANQRDKKRVLLVGDSIAKGYHGFVKELLGAHVYVDKLATSKALDNPALYRELDYIVRHGDESFDFSYEVVHFNNGLHGWHLGEAEYERGCDDVVQHLRRHTQAAIVLAHTTPVTKAAAEEYALDSAVNDRVIARNRVVDRVAARYGLAVNDLYAPMIGRRDYEAGDGYHYNESGRSAQAELVARSIAAALGIAYYRTDASGSGPRHVGG